MTTYINPMNDLTPALAGLADTVANIVNPNYKLQQALRAKIATDPSLAQHLADTEDAAPGTLEALGLGKLGKIIAKIPPSSSEILERQTQSGLRDFLKNPKNVQDVVSRSTTGQTTAQNQLDTEKAQIGQTQVNQAQRNEQVASQSQKLVENYKSDSGTGLYAFASDVVNGKVQQDTLTPILGDDSPYGKSVRTAIDVLLKVKDQQNNLDIAQARDANRLKDVSATSLLNRATQVYLKTKSGSVQGIEKILSDPKALERANYLADHPNEAKSPEDKDLLESMQGMDRMDQAERQANVAAAGVTIMKLVGSQQDNEQTHGNDPAMRSQIISSIQEQLNIRSQFGAPQLLVNYGRPPGHTHIYGFRPDEQIYYTDKNGNVVNPNAALTNFTGTSAQLLKLAPQAYSDWKNAEDKKAAYTDMIKTKSGAAMAQLLSVLYPDFNK